MTEKPPPWIARNQIEREAMVQWVHRKLDELQAAEALGHKGDKAAHVAWLEADGPEIYYAERGNIAPLKKKYSRLAPFLFAITPKKPTKETLQDAIATAVWAYKIIPEIWQQGYQRKNRPYDQVGRLEIAARWMDVTQQELLTRMKKSGPSGKSRKKPTGK